MSIIRFVSILAFAALALPRVASGQIVFEPPVLADSGGAGSLVPSSLRVADFTADGRPDVAVSHAFALNVTIAAGLGDGTFATPFALPDLAGSRQVELVDVDGDGLDDLLASKDGNLWIKPGLGGGAHAPATAASTLTLPNNAIVVFGIGDVTDDAVPDAIVATSGFLLPSSLLLLPGLGDGSFGPPTTVADGSFGTIYGFPKVADLDDDGHGDVVVTSAGQVLLGHGDGTFDTVAAPFGVEPEFADLDDDGHLDLVARSGSNVAVMLGDGAGGFDAVHYAAGADAVDLALIDLSGDGQLDVAMLNQVAHEVTVLLGHADGTFTQAVTVSGVTGNSALEAGDFDGDGLADLVANGAEQAGANPLDVILNHTYRPGQPFTDLGHASSGSSGYPIQLADGSLVGGRSASFRLAGAPPAAGAWLVVGFSPLALPFADGTLVPSPDLLLGPFEVDAGGDLVLAGPWPVGMPPGTRLYFQFWAVETGTFCSTSAVLAVTP